MRLTNNILVWCVLLKVAMSWSSEYAFAVDGEFKLDFKDIRFDALASDDNKPGLVPVGSVRLRTRRPYATKRLFEEVRSGDIPERTRSSSRAITDRPRQLRCKRWIAAIRPKLRATG